MKKFTLTCLAVISAFLLFAQTPQAFKYQAVARDNAGNILSEQPVSFRISILMGYIGGPSVYVETHTDTTNQFGLINLEIGNGTIESGVFEEIGWGGYPYFLKIEITENGGITYQLMGTTQLLAVPYALYSESTGDTSRWKKNNDDLYFNNGNVGIGTDSPLSWTKLDVRGNLSVDGYTLLSQMDGSEVVLELYNTISDWELVAASDNNRFDIRKWGGVPALSISDNNFIGIGTINPNAKLDIRGIGTDDAAMIRIGNSDGSHSLSFFPGRENDPNPFIQWKEGDPLRFSTDEGGWSEKMRITSDGKVGIGTENPSYKFEVKWEPPGSNINPIALFKTTGSTNSAAALRVQNTSNNYYNFGMTHPGNNYFSIAYNANIGLSADLMTITPGGNMGIGTTTPTEMLEVADTIYSSVGGFKFPDGTVQETSAGSGGVISIDDLTDGKTVGNSVFLGSGAGDNDDGTDNYNVAVGDSALYTNMSGSYNTAYGYRALLSNTGSFNTAIGYNALYFNTSAGYITAIGNRALYYNTTGDNITAIGSHALYHNTTGDYNTANGTSALYSKYCRT